MKNLPDEARLLLSDRWLPEQCLRRGQSGFLLVEALGHYIACSISANREPAGRHYERALRIIQRGDLPPVAMPMAELVLLQGVRAGARAGRVVDVSELVSKEKGRPNWRSGAGDLHRSACEAAKQVNVEGVLPVEAYAPAHMAHLVVSSVNLCVSLLYCKNLGALSGWLDTVESELPQLASVARFESYVALVGEFVERLRRFVFYVENGE